MQRILAKAEPADFAFIVGLLESPLQRAGGRKLRAALAAFEANGDGEARQNLADKLEEQLRYAGSADFAYFVRKQFGTEPGVKLEEIINDVAKKLKVSIRPLGSVEAKLERLVMTIVEREFLSLDPEKQRQLLRELDVGPSNIDEILKRVGRLGPVAVIPTVIAIAGREVAQRIITNIVVGLLGKVIGREAAKQLLRALTKRFPWWARWIGPLGWLVSGTWLSLDLQGPAYRKTIPVMLYLGLIGLRDGSEDDREA